MKQAKAMIERKGKDGKEIRIIAPTKSTTLNMQTLDGIRKKRISLHVLKWLNYYCLPPLRNAFGRFHNDKDTRANELRLILPEVKQKLEEKCVTACATDLGLTRTFYHTSSSLPSFNSCC